MISAISYFFAMSFKIVLNVQANVNNWDNFGPSDQEEYDGPVDCSQESMFTCFEDI